MLTKSKRRRSEGEEGEDTMKTKRSRGDSTSLIDVVPFVNSTDMTELHDQINCI